MNKDIQKVSKKQPIFFDNRRLQAYLIYNTTPNITQAQLSEYMGVSSRTIWNWLESVKLEIDEGRIVESAKKRMVAMVPQAANVYSQALEQGQVKADFVSLQAAKDVLKNKGIIQDKVEVEHSLKSKSDKELMEELRLLTDGDKQVDGGVDV